MLKLERFITGKLYTNCYVLYNSETCEGFVFDAPAHGEEIFKFVNGLNVKIKGIVLTHSHFDHILALPKLKELSGAPVYIHKSEAELINDKEFNLTRYFRADLPPICADIKLSDGDELTLGEEKIKVIHTPGHTIGGLSFLWKDILISGDTLFYDSVGKVDHPTGDMALEIKNIKEKLLVLPDDTKVYPGHGEMTTIGRERKENIFLR